MKKSILVLSILSTALLSGTASAANEVRFLGAVTDVTCDLVPEVGGAVKNVVQLGAVKPFKTGATDHNGAEIDFALKPANGATCAAIDTLTATIAFDGNLNTQGLGAQSGAADDANVLIKAKNAQNNDTTPLVQGKNTRTFDGTDINTDGAQFSAQLVGGTKIGDFQTAIAYAVSYQ